MICTTDRLQESPGAVIQGVVPLVDPPESGPARKRSPPSRGPARAVTVDDEHVRSYLHRLATYGSTAKGIGTHKYQLRAAFRAVARLSGSPVTVTARYRNAALLGHALVDYESANETRLSKRMLAQRRSAIPSFTAFMRPERLKRLGEEPVSDGDPALRGGGDCPRRRQARTPK